MTCKVFVTRPDHDDETKYLYEYSKEYIKFIENKDIQLISFSENKCSRENVEKLILKQNPNLIVFNGHGNEEVICGCKENEDRNVLTIKIRDSQRDEIIIDMKNKEILKSKIIYSVACSSAKKLGMKVAKSHTKTAFIGYEEEFIFLMDTRKMCKPLSDQIARPFLESSNQVVISLLKGETTGEAYNKSQVTFQKWIDYFQSEKAALHDSISIAWILFSNKECQKLHGNRDVRLF